MKKHISVVLAATMLCLLPILCLSPLLFGAQGRAKNCGYQPFNGPCGYSGCPLAISRCSDNNNKGQFLCGTAGQNTSISVNFFTCVVTNPPDKTVACDPVLDQNGNAATTDCVLTYGCVYNNNTGACTQGKQTGTCPAPYYQKDTCP